MYSITNKLPKIPKLDYFQHVAVWSAIAFTILGAALYFPIQKIFKGSWVLKQQVTIQIFENSASTSEIFNGTIAIRFYALCILIGMLLGYIFALKIAKRHYIASNVIDRLLIGLVIFGLFGARLLYVLFNSEIFLSSPIQILRLQEGGLSFFGMLISATIYLYLYCRRFKFSFFEFTDMLAMPLLIGQIFGRFGNFFNYESYGGPTSVIWKMYVPDSMNIYESINQKFFHPTFLYEIIPNITLLLCILWSYGELTKKRSGLVFAMYCIGYGTIRFFTEFFRLDALTVPLPSGVFSILGIPLEMLYVSQILALLIVAIGMYIYVYRSKIIYLRKTMIELTTHKQRKVMFN
jgi:phosphatidylglycerol---prolipoprotein diacylglyceryl transferase